MPARFGIKYHERAAAFLLDAVFLVVPATCIRLLRVDRWANLDRYDVLSLLLQ